MDIYNLLDMIGNTPMLELKRKGLFVKAEFLNPSGSIKDRIALSMIAGAEKNKKIDKNSIIVEATSGNTGISVALVGKIKGYRVIIVMPENMSLERRRIIELLGADLILTPQSLNIEGSVLKAEELNSSHENVYVLNQFKNPDNVRAHYEGTAREIWNQLEGKISCFISGVGSGGTLQGVGKYLKEMNPRIKIFAVEPKNYSAILGHEPGLHQIEGIGDGFIPEILDTGIIDDVIEVSDDDAITTTRQITSLGYLVGISSGANYWAADYIHKKNKGNVVTIFPDRVERYFSTALMKKTCQSEENLQLSISRIPY